MSTFTKALGDVVPYSLIYSNLLLDSDVLLDGSEAIGSVSPAGLTVSVADPYGVNTGTVTIDGVSYAAGLVLRMLMSDGAENVKYEVVPSVNTTTEAWTITKRIQVVVYKASLPLVKDPNSDGVFYLVLEDWLEPGDSLLAPTPTQGAGAELTISGITINSTILTLKNYTYPVGTVVQFELSGGTDGNREEFYLQGNTANGFTYRRYIDVRIRDS